MTKQEVLKMTLEEIRNHRWTDDDCNDSCVDCGECSDCIDCDMCQGCKDCISCKTSWDCLRCYRCANCSDCWYCVDCKFCNDCFMCSGSENLKYAILNVELTKEEYENKLKELDITI